MKQAFLSHSTIRYTYIAFEFYISICYSIFDQSIEQESEMNKIVIVLYLFIIDRDIDQKV